MKHLLYILVLLGSGLQSPAQFRSIQQRVEHVPSASFSDVTLFRSKINTPAHQYLTNYVKRFDLLESDPAGLQFLAHHTGPVRITLPIDGQWKNLLLVKNEALNQFKVSAQSESGISDYPYQPGSYFLGTIENEIGSFAAISFFEDDIIGMVVTPQGNFVVGKSNLKKPVNDEYIVYNDRDLLHSDQQPCAFQEDLHAIHAKQSTEQVTTPEAYTTNCVKFYFECDYETYLDKGSSVPNTTNYATGLFNLTSTLYLNDSVITGLAQINVWTVTDPYAAAANTSAMLNAFSSQMSSTVYNADLAHLLSTRSAGGGIAWLDVLCASNYYKTGVSASLSATITPLPTYSWNAEVITHEIGHNLGSPHTHACAWNGNNTRIDNCAGNYNVQYQEGNCNSFPPNPAGGGTIMSYCHLQAVGINFANGFGLQPGNLIRTNINTAPCLGICLACDADVTITGTYSNALTESSTWISSSGQTTILSTASVKLDADASAGYVLLAPASNAEAFTAAPSTNSAMFVAQAFNGCTNGSPSRPNEAGSELTNQSETESELQVFPNPAGNRITLRSPTYSGKPFTLCIFSMDGRSWFKSAAGPFDQQQELDISALPAGMYLLKLQQENDTQVLRFQKI